MHKSLLSLTIGAALALFTLSTAFALVSLAYPGWLRAAVSAPAPVAPTEPASVPTATETIVEGEHPLDPVQTAEPLPTSPDATCGGPQQLTIALLGVDDRGEGYERATRTDAITLVRVDFTTHTAALFSIPRDLYVALPNLKDVGIEQDRINTAFLYGEAYDVPGGGPAEFKSTVELNFGIRVDRYVLVNFGAFVSAVDALGGIEVDVPTAIYDPKFPTSGGGTMVLEIPAGLQPMDGQTALRYARTRHQDDDYHRVQRQQLVLFAIRDKLLSPEVIPHLPALLTQLGGLVRTDLSAGEMASLACLGPQIDRAAIKALAIDGTLVIPWTTPTGGRVSIPNREAIAPLVREFLGQ